MADFEAHYKTLTCKVFVKGTGYVSKTLVNCAAIWRRLRPVPFNVRGVETPRPAEGQIWPRGLPQQGES